MEKNKKDLEYCPVCGHSLKIVEDEENTAKVKVYCYVCEFEGGSFDNEDDALKAWGKKD